MKSTNLRAKCMADALTSGLLRDLLDGIRSAMKADDDRELQSQQPKHGVRYYADFREWGNAIENTLEDRGEQYVPIDWSPRK